jgi:cyclophilin family peptidyl-prolyl cis-trans isomerase
MAPKYNRKKPVQTKSKPKSGSSKKWLALVAVLAIVLIIVGVYYTGGFGTSNNNPTTTPTPTPTATPLPTPATNQTRVLLQTSMGNIVLQFRADKPITTANFLKLVAQGKYNNTIFHRVIEGFMVQGGNTGDSSIPNIADEIGTNNHNYNGTIAMANTGAPNSASSQFFINVMDNNNRYASFDTSYTVFGNVVSGMDVVMAISHVDTDSNDKPIQNVTLIGASIIA